MTLAQRNTRIALSHLATWLPLAALWGAAQLVLRAVLSYPGDGSFDHTVALGVVTTCVGILLIAVGAIVSATATENLCRRYRLSSKPAPRS